MQSVPLRVIARVRDNKEETVSSCLELRSAALTVLPFVSAEAPSSERRSSPRRSSVAANVSNRKSSIGCSSLIPRTPHTPRGLLRGVLSVFPVLEEASAVAERFEASAVLPPLAPQDALFQLLLPDLQAVLAGYRASVLCYGVAESGKSYTLWGTEADKGFVPRALELLFATAPAGCRVTMTLIGLDDMSAVDYLSPQEEEPIHSPQFKDGLDGGKTLARCTHASVTDAASAWDTVLGGLSRATSDRHTILTINMFLPRGDDSSLVGTLQVAEISLPGADERMSRNVSTLHDVVRSLGDKNFRGSVDYSGSLLTTLVQPAFGGNSRTSVILTVHQSIQHYHHTIQTMTFGDLCGKLKNVTTPVVLPGVTPVVSVDAPAEMVGQIKELRSYAEELELENDDLRRRLQVWEDRVADGKSRFELDIRREQEASQARSIESEALIASLGLQLQQALVTNDAQEMMLARLRVQLVRNQSRDLAEVEKSAALHAESLMAKLAELKNQPAVVEAVAVQEAPRPSAELKEQLLALQKETEELRAALLEQQQLGQSVQKPAVLSSAVLREKDAEIRAMNEEMRIKELEMAEREREIEELNDKVDFLTAQVHTINFLKASVNSLAARPISSQVSQASFSSQQPQQPAAVKKTKASNASDPAVVAAAKAKAKAQVAQKKRDKEEREEAERQARLAREEDERIEAEMRREQIRQEKQARARAKREREQQKKKEEKERAEQQRKEQEQHEEEEEREEDVEESAREEPPVPPPRPVPLSKRKKQKKDAQPEQQEEQEEVRVEQQQQREEVPEIEEPVPTPLPTRGKKRSNSSKKAAPAQMPDSPLPALKPVATKRVPSPNENNDLPQQQAQEPAQKKGRKKLYNGAEKKSKKPEFRKSLAPTPASAAPVTRTNAAALGRLGGGADDYRSMLGDLLDNNLYAVQTPMK